MNRKNWQKYMVAAFYKKKIFWIIVAAFLFRLAGIFDGLPATYNSTEYYHAKLAMSMGARQSLDPQISGYDIFNPRLFIYPMFFQYLTVIEYAVLYLLGLLLGYFKDSYDFAIRFLVEPSIFYITCRFVNVLISTITVYSIYAQLQRIYNEKTALFASSIFALSYFMILASIQSVSDSWLLFFSTMTILFVLRSYYEPVKKNFIISSIYAGLAIATKYNAGVLLFMFPILIWETRNRLKVTWVGLSINMVIVIIITFLLINPYHLVHLTKYIEGFRLVSTQASQAITPEMGLNYWWEFSQIVKSELLVGLLFFISVFYFLFKRQKELSILLVMIIVTYFYVGSWQKKGIDYLYAVYPAFIILSAMLLNKMFDEKSNIGKLILPVIIIPSLLMAIYQNTLRVKNDTREIATQWIIEKVDRTDKICYDNYHYDLGLFDINRYTKYGAGASQLPVEIRSRLDNYSDNTRNFSFIPIMQKMETPVINSKNLFEQENSQYIRKTFDQLQQEGIKYLITNEWNYQPFLEVDTTGYSPVVKYQVKQYREFYKVLENNKEPVKSINAGLWTPGPNIKIYQLDH